MRRWDAVLKCIFEGKWLLFFHKVSFVFSYFCLLLLAHLFCYCMMKNAALILVYWTLTLKICFKKNLKQWKSWNISFELLVCSLPISSNLLKLNRFTKICLFPFYKTVSKLFDMTAGFWETFWLPQIFRFSAMWSPLLLPWHVLSNKWLYKLEHLSHSSLHMMTQQDCWYTRGNMLGGMF